LAALGAKDSSSWGYPEVEALAGRTEICGLRIVFRHSPLALLLLTQNRRAKSRMRNGVVPMFATAAIEHRHEQSRGDLRPSAYPPLTGVSHSIR
jgi:hypothetical protein